MTKKLNSRCHCGKGLTRVRQPVVMLMPCEHLIHKDCVISNCPYCKKQYSHILTLSECVKNKDLQRSGDILSMTNFDYHSENSLVGMYCTLTYTVDILYSLFNNPTRYDIREMCGQALGFLHARVDVKGMDRLIEGPKVFIANHTSALDFLVIMCLFNTNFLTSSEINNTSLGKYLAEILPVLIIDRGKSSNTVEKMKKFLQQHNSICIFPEGMMTHPETIAQFRTGAFHTGYPVQPIVIKYQKYFGDMNDFNFILKVMSGVSKENIDVTVMDPYYPPFNDAKIEEVRQEMAKVGKLMTSRVSNKDILD